jgi:hypothetical protein
MITVILPYFQLCVSFGTLCGLVYGFYKFSRKPHDTLESRISTLETRLNVLEATTSNNTDDIKAQQERCEIIRTCVEALVDFELAYCISTHYEAEGIDDLKRAKKTLREHKE